MTFSASVQYANEVLQHGFGDGAGSVASVQPVSPGMSGAQVYRVTTRSGEAFALKCYPAMATLDRVQEIHRVMQAARSAGCELVPRLISAQGSRVPATAIRYRTECWELVTWMPGNALDRSVDSGPLLAAVSQGAAAIARFHQAARSLGTQVQVPLCIRSRQSRIAEVSPLLRSLLTRDLDCVANPLLRQTVALAVDRLRDRWHAVSRNAMTSLEALSRTKVPCSYVLRDCHREHVFFTEFQNHGSTTRSVSGIIDMDAVRMDAAAADLARWTGSFVKNGISVHQLWDAAVAGYRLESSLKVQQEALARELAPISAWISLANWAIWLLLEQRRFPVADEAILRRIEHLIEVVDRFETE
ncbi:phosphotransferase enzyme family protein [Novipirellula artificiosorum]|uniref:Phosphotransferase enzyme family protein n=1 Tax=Novipirellula artificiosorum TaxID=2528016 RepID=A0A5C6DQW0_9BACT|nr:phosphotransferase [Novipirellula artificiosorum]TWU37149.1 Phosphotransferase enzyme family protein [Novipirellula artificiosorum]